MLSQDVEFSCEPVDLFDGYDVSRDLLCLS